MIGYLKGKIQYFSTQKVILEVQGCGYEVNFSMAELNIALGSDLELYIVQKFSEYGVTLFGFKSVDEKLIFESLDSIKGVGSRIIFTIMSFLSITSAEDLHRITLDELVNLPGVGKNTAQKFLLGLSGKLKKEFSLDASGPVKASIESKYADEIQLLIEWGMKKNHIIEFFKNNQERLQGISSQELIKMALKELK